MQRKFVIRLRGIGAEHQSNVRSRDLSRSWNRVYTTLPWPTEDYAFRFKPWYHIAEDDKDDPTDTDGDDDDDPDIQKYMGYFVRARILR